MQNKLSRCLAGVIALVTALSLCACDNNNNTPPPKATKEIPLLVVLASFDADGNGINDYDEATPDKLFADQTKPYYGEQWAGTTVTDHYNNFFGDGLSVGNYYKELSMGAFRFVPMEFDVLPEESPVTNGVLHVVVPIKHPTASGDAQGAITRIFSACDPYIDFSKYDENGNGKLDPMEFCVVIINSGADASSSSGKSQINQSSPRFHFEVWGTSQALSARLDGVSFYKVSNVGEYKTVGSILPIGVPVHELAHNLGTEDLYDRNVGGTGSAVSGWPRAYNFSLQSNGNSAGGGTTPTYLDPYQRIYLDWAEEKTVEDGTYTIHSTLSGKYSVLRVNTPNPDEYYLIEVRLKESFEKNLTSGTSKGGIMVWHIDESVNRRFFADGMTSSSYADSTGKRHDPGIVPLFREGYDLAGRMMAEEKPADPFYYLSDDPTTSVCDTGAFFSATNGTQSLNHYPASWEGKENFNICIEVLSEPSESMTVKITTGRKDFAPVLSVTYSEKNHTSMTVMGKIEARKGADITECGVIFSDTPDFSSNVTTKLATVENETFKATFDGLEPETRYYYRVYANSSVGTVYAKGDTPTSSIPQGKTSTKVTLYAQERGYTISVAYGKTLVIPERWLVGVMNKMPGQKIEGWYYDKDYTKPFELSTVIEKGTEDFPIYAKWIAE